MSHQQSQEAFAAMTVEVDLTIMKGSPHDQESTPSTPTDDDSQQSLTVQLKPSIFSSHRGFTTVSLSEPHESGNEDDTNDEVPNIDLEARAPKPSFVCEVCSKVFQKRSRLVSHMVAHSERKDHICSVCGKGFKNKPQLIRHSNTHSAVPNFCCNICGRGFKHNDVAKHIRRWHSGPRKSNRGGVPNPSAQNNDQLVAIQVRKKKRSQHTAQQTMEHVPQSLNQPNHQSLNEKTHQRRIVESHVSQQEIFHAEPQLRPFSGNPLKKEGMLRGTSSQNQVPQDPLDLNVCSEDALNGKILEDSSSLLSVFQCPHCNMSFSKHQELTHHIMTHKETGEGKVNQSKDNKKHHQCHICNKTFTRASGLTGHMHLHTRTEKRREPNPNLRCHICDKIFTRQSGLNAHILQHGGVLRFWCDETDCDKGFVHSYQLIRHKRLHSEVPPYSCEVCGRAFRHNDLAKHMRTHTGVKPYNCQHCGRAFAFNSSLRAHERIHLALKEHVCDVCNMGFTTTAGLRRHAKCHEAEEEKLCTFCGELFSSKLHLSLHLQESPHCAEQLHKHQPHHQALSETTQAPTVQLLHQHHQDSPQQPPGQHLQHVHEQHVQHLQHLQVMSLPPVPQVRQEIHKMHGHHESHQQVTQQSHPISIHSLGHLHLPHHSETTLASLSAASTEPVDSGPTSGQALPVLVPFSVSVPISVPYGVHPAASDPLHLNHFLSWETKY